MGPDAGRVVIDADVMGSGVDFSALVDTQARALRGPRAALGHLPGRSARCAQRADDRSVSTAATSRWWCRAATPSRPSSGRWARTSAASCRPRSPVREGQRLALRMDPETGELFAVSGEGRDARVLGDGLWLGPYWRQLLGDSPRLAVGCLEGRCVFRQVLVRGLELPAGSRRRPSPQRKPSRRATTSPAPPPSASATVDRRPE